MAILKAFDRMTPSDIEGMQTLNDGMREALAATNFDLYTRRTWPSTTPSLNFCGNVSLVKLANNLKKRLYDFPRPKGFVNEWSEASVREHQAFIDLLREAGARTRPNMSGRPLVLQGPGAVRPEDTIRLSPGGRAVNQGIGGRRTSRAPMMTERPESSRVPGYRGELPSFCRRHGPGERLRRPD